ncbi:YjiH family protein [Bacillus sp. AGMB 02131]|uniref:YjiH family protein n=1 Tax=Peribacillus faecalis TaxID=2772559 RepID=A0A927CYL3_9BACI|nr:YjiH family protein [Peribacillus faecalis]MBD3110068.1 YjiH family protein [Peribacillus faecalis]
MNNLAQKQNEQLQQSTYTAKDYLKFLIPSLIGILLFIVPIKADGSITIPIAFLSGQIMSAVGDYIPLTAVIFIVSGAIGTVFAVLAKPAFIINRPFLNNLLNVSIFWMITRVIGAVIAVLTLWQFGPSWIISENTGDTLLHGLIPTLFTTFFLAGILLPLLLNFGLLEFAGALFMRIMRPVFKLPGRSSLDCLASWVGDGTIGVLLTAKQYEEGYYTKREAAVIATTFSVVSITFSIVILQQLDLEQYFLPYYFTIVLAGFVAAIIMPRIPPLSKKADISYEQVEMIPEDDIPSDVSLAKWGLNSALRKASKNDKVSSIFKEGFQNVLDMWVGVLPVVMAIGTIGLIIAEYTPAFAILGKPFEPILALMQVPEAAEAAQTMVVGFADMLLPAILGSGIESELTRFVIACVSVTQLVYLSEMGGLVLGSKIPVNFWDLVLIFILRTIITLPIIVVIAHIIF